MKSVFGRSLLLALLALFCAPAATPQGLGLIPNISGQYFDNNGNPLGGGFIVSCGAGLTCSYPVPGNPATTFTDNSGFTSNPNPTPLDASGRASIWLTAGFAYKFVIVSSAGTTLRTIDNVVAAPSSGGSTTNYWTLASGGTSISNNNASGTGDVALGGGLTVANDVEANGNLKLRDAGVSPNYVLLRAANTMTADVQWRWAAADAAGCLTSDGSGNLSFLPCGSGGGGSPGGSNSNVQFNSSGTFGGSGNFAWDSANQRIVILGVTATPGIVSVSSYVQSEQGFLASNVTTPSTPLSYNVIQAPTGGVYASSLTAINYVESGSSTGAPTATTGESGFPHPGTLYCDTTSSPCTEKLYNGSAWISLATGGATSPGGASTNVQFNSGGSFAGSSNLIFAAQRLTVIGSSAGLPAIYSGTGYIQSDAGFLASPGSANQFNSIQAPAGGVLANSLTASTYVQAGHSPGPFSTAPPTPTAGDTLIRGALSWDDAGSTLRVYNGSTWLALPGSGGGGTPGGPTTSIQFNNGGSFQGVAGLEWNGTAIVVNPGSAIPGLVVANGYAQAEVGFLAAVVAAPATPLSYNAIQAPTGGVYAKSLKAINYIQTGSSTGAPTATTGDTIAAGAMYWDNSGVERVFNGASWVSLATGGVSSVNALTGALSITNGGTTNQITVSPSGTNIALTLPQGIGTASSPTFAGVFATGVFNSTATSGSAFVANGGAAQIFANGNIGAQTVNANTYQIGSTTVIDGSRVGTFTNVVSSGSFTTTVIGTTVAFSSGGGIFSINGRGDIAGPGSINMVGSFGIAPYRVNSTDVIDASRNGFFNNMTISGICTGCSGVSSITGTANQVNASASTGAVTLSLPQSIATSSSPTFASVIATGLFSSTATSGNAFVANGGAAIVFANGNISGQVFNSNGYQIGGSTVINGSSQFSGTLNTPLGSNSILSIGTAGSLYTRSFAASSGVFCGGVQDGWIGVSTTDQMLVVCLGGARYRVALTAY